MKLAKAIELLDLKVKGCNPYLSKDTDDACKLGIEALKLLSRLRADGIIGNFPGLPGETPE